MGAASKGGKQPYFSFPQISSHNPWLDVLRALAILLVLVRHGGRALLEVVPGLHPPAALVNFTLNGWAGVDLFLVLSGFLIGSSLLKQFRKERVLAVYQYFQKRILRIVPAYYAVLALTVAVAGWSGQYTPGELARETAHHLLFMQDYLGSDFNIVFWSLGVEEKFYIAAPLIVLLLMKIRSARLALLCVALFMLASPVMRWLGFEGASALTYTDYFPQLRSPFHMTTDPLVAGVAIALLHHIGVRLSEPVAKALFVVSGLVMLIFLSAAPYMSEVTRLEASLVPLVLALGFGAMVYAATCLTAAPSHWLERPARITARLSYTLYLVHYPLVPLSLVVAIAWPTPLVATFIVTYLAISFLAAGLLHFLVEKPFLRLKDRKPRAADRAATSNLLSPVPNKPA